MKGRVFTTVAIVSPLSACQNDTHIKTHSVMLKAMTVTRYLIGYSSKMHNPNVGQKRLILNEGPDVPAAVRDSA